MGVENLTDEQIQNIKRLCDLRSSEEIAAEVNLGEEVVKNVALYVRRAWYVGKGNIREVHGLKPGADLRHRVQSVLAKDGYAMR
ncbi:hypothetical protein ACFL9T_01240 [Thermodesulfobacteriota bacterium]